MDIALLHRHALPTRAATEPTHFIALNGNPACAIVTYRHRHNVRVTALPPSIPDALA